MTTFASGPFVTGLAVTAAVALGTFLVTFVIARRIGRWNVVDVTWGSSFVLIALASFLWAQRSSGGAVRPGLVLALTAVWGLRLSMYIALRSRGKGEDPRYQSMLGAGAGTVRVLQIVFLPQAFLAWLVSLPVQVSMYEGPGPGPLAWVAVALWVVGFAFESIGDRQMDSFRRDPSNRGQVMDRGLWRYTRHPNYFGDATVWTALYLIAAEHWPGALTVISPIVMGYFLCFKSGKGLLERSLSESKPGYADYVARTSGFIPRPPRRSG